LKKRIAALNTKDLVAVRDYCNLLLGTTAVTSGFQQPTGTLATVGSRSREESNGNQLYIAISSQLEQRFHMATQPFPAYMRVYEKKRLIVSATDRLTQFCEKNLPSWTSATFVSVCTRFARYTADDLELYGVPVTLKNILQAVDRWEDTLDRRFPGYIQSGMISIVFINQINRLHRREKNRR
jgi:hypothetical protein